MAAQERRNEGSHSRVVSVEGRKPDQALIHNDTQTPPITLWPIALLGEHLRGNVVRRADCGIYLSEVTESLSERTAQHAGENIISTLRRNGIIMLRKLHNAYIVHSQA